MAIIIANARRSQASIEKAFPGAVIVNLTSKAKDDFVKFSPFYPHGGIPVPFSPGWTSESVEGIWQGLKVFSDFGVNTSKFKVASMSGLKRLGLKNQVQHRLKISPFPRPTLPRAFASPGFPEVGR